MFKKVLISLILIFIPHFCWANGVVNIYSGRHYDTDFALYDRFSSQTGIEVKLIEGTSDGLIERIKNEKEFSPADVLITVDAGRLWRAKDQGLFQISDSSLLSERIPSHLRDPEGYWFGFSVRARVIILNKNHNFGLNISNYEDLASPLLRNSICMRSSNNIYNLSLMASLVKHLGIDESQNWAEKVVANFARNPQGNDTAQIKAVSGGKCLATIANTYYVARLVTSDSSEDQAVYNNIRIVFPNQSNRGTHVNISGAGILKNAPNYKNAIKFMEFMTEDFAQNVFSKSNNEYSVTSEGAGPVYDFGKFKQDTVNASLLGENQSLAVKIFDRAGWN